MSWAHGCGLVGVDGCGRVLDRCWVGLTSKVLTGNGQDGRPAMVDLLHITMQVLWPE